MVEYRCYFFFPNIFAINLASLSSFDNPAGLALAAAGVVVVVVVVVVDVCVAGVLLLLLFGLSSVCFGAGLSSGFKNGGVVAEETMRNIKWINE